jgi:hypothetical protein
MRHAGLACAHALVVLNASKNQLANLPGDLLASWLAVKELDVSHNQLAVGTLSLYKMHSLQLHATSLH